MRAWLWSIAHNCIVHPLYPFLPVRWVDLLHDFTARRAFDEDPS